MQCTDERAKREDEKFVAVAEDGEKEQPKVHSNASFEKRVTWHKKFVLKSRRLGATYR